MKLLLLLLFLPCLLIAQSSNDCMKDYEKCLKKANEFAQNGDYKEALTTYSAASIIAKDCGEDREGEINDKIAELFEAIEKRKDDAEAAEREARDAKERTEKAYQALLETHDSKSDKEDYIHEQSIMHQKALGISDSLSNRLVGGFIYYDSTGHRTHRQSLSISSSQPKQSFSKTYQNFMTKALLLTQEQSNEQNPDFQEAIQYFAIAQFTKEAEITQNIPYRLGLPERASFDLAFRARALSFYHQRTDELLQEGVLFEQVREIGSWLLMLDQLTLAEISYKSEKFNEATANYKQAQSIITDKLGQRKKQPALESTLEQTTQQLEAFIKKRLQAIED